MALYRFYRENHRQLKNFSANFANSRESSNQFAKIRVLRGKGFVI